MYVQPASTECICVSIFSIISTNTYTYIYSQLLLCICHFLSFMELIQKNHILIIFVHFCLFFFYVSNPKKSYSQRTSPLKNSKVFFWRGDEKRSWIFLKLLFSKTNICINEKKITFFANTYVCLFERCTLKRCFFSGRGIRSCMAFIYVLCIILNICMYMYVCIVYIHFFDSIPNNLSIYLSIYLSSCIDE